jgi:hypothetical protein
VIRKFLVILIAFGLTQGVLSFCLTEDLNGMTKGEVMLKEGKSSGFAPGEIRYFAQKANRAVELKDEFSKNVALAPPCSVIAINGKKLTLKDFYGKQEAIIVEDIKDLTGLKVGDKVVVKDGFLIIGRSPQ